MMLLGLRSSSIVAGVQGRAGARRVWDELADARRIVPLGWFSVDKRKRHSLGQSVLRATVWCKCRYSRKRLNEGCF
jgi:hypothetical protein